ncbi:hypothetical protein ACWF5H_01285 [Arthrobacter sp. NPDC055138]
MFRVAGAAALTLGVLTACGQLPGDDGQAQREPAELVDAIDCTAAGRAVEQGEPGVAPLPAAGGVPEGFVAVEAIRCDAFMLATLEDEEGLWSAVTEERLAGDLIALVDALAQPSDQPRANQACTADMELVPDLWLVDVEGQAMRAAWPTNSCGKTKPGVREVLGGMEVVESTQHKLELIQPRAALEANCPAEWSIAPLTGIAVEPPMGDLPGPGAAHDGEGVAGSPGLLPSADEADTLRICQYRTGPALNEEDGPPAGAEQDPHVESVKIVSGRFSGGGSLGGSAKDAILKAAAADAIDATCDDEAAEFAVLWPVADGLDVGAPLTAELDGCQRLFGPDGAARNLPREASTAVVVALEK